MKTLKNSIRLCLVLILVCGIIYPLAITAIGQTMFNNEANGSIIKVNGKAVGSELLGQAYSNERYFHGRVSSLNYNTYKDEDVLPDKDGKVAYSGVASGSSNLAASNPALTDRVKKDIDEFLKAHPGVKKEDIPTDLLTNSASGLDPDISPASAAIQIPAISKATGLTIDELNGMVAKYTEGRQLGIFGEPRVNVIKLNVELDSKLKALGK
jgi:potassium-transporting ATPase KdpC subunit